MQNAALWTRIAACHPDDVEADFRFSHRLARDNGWRKRYAERVVLEYLRFVYLSQLKAGIVTPSDEVDQAWHLHLTYTKHYWGCFREALGQPLHHMPTKGGPDQAALFRQAYARTLDLYRDEFGEPPADIWPPEDIRFGKAPHFQRVNTRDVWLISRPTLPGRLSTALNHFGRLPSKASVAALAIAAFAFGTGLAFAHGEPQGDTFIERLRSMVWHWATEHTIIFLAVVFVIFIVVRAIFIKATGGGSSGCGAGSGCGTHGSGDGGGSGCSGCGGGD
ncbi:glycine-rich domain-containing protein [Roseibium sp. M-1]